MRIDKENIEKFYKVYHNKFILFIIWFFVFFDVLTGTIVIMAVKNGYGSYLLPVTIFSGILIILIMILVIFYKIRIEVCCDYMVVYGRKYENTLKQSFEVGTKIEFSNIYSIDLIPIKYFNLVLSYQLYIKTLNNEEYYINSFSSLDDLFTEIRALRFKRKQKK